MLYVTLRNVLTPALLTFWHDYRQTILFISVTALYNASTRFQYPFSNYIVNTLLGKRLRPSGMFWKVEFDLLVGITHCIFKRQNHSLLNHFFSDEDKKFKPCIVSLLRIDKEGQRLDSEYIFCEAQYLFFITLLERWWETRTLGEVTVKK